MKVILDLKDCRSCPFFKEGPAESTDGFDRGHDWICTKKEKERIISGFVEWHEENKIPVPQWCPIRVRKKKSISVTTKRLSKTRTPIIKFDVEDDGN